MTDSEVVEAEDYTSQAFSRFQQYRDDDLLCDLTLKAENHLFKVHKLVLAGCSDYFRAMFSHNMADSNNSTLELHSVSARGLSPLLEFAYSGKLLLSLDSIQDILAVATFLQVTSAISICVKFLKSKMTFANAEQLMSLADNYGISELSKHYRRLILDKFAEFAETDAFLNLDAKGLADLLKEDSLRISTEGDLLKCVLKWYHFDKASREEEAFDVFEKIRYTIDGWPTIEHACSIEPFTNNPKCRELIDWCHRYMQNAHQKHLNQSHRTRVRYDCKSLVQMGGVINNIPDSVDYFNTLERTGNQSNFYYHQHLDTWLPLGVVGISDPRSHCCFVEVNDFGILCGGYVYTSEYDETYRHCTNEVKLVATGAFSIWDMPYMKAERAHHVLVPIKDFLYAVGGKNEHASLDSVEKYDLLKEKWSFVEPLDKAVYDHAGAAFSGLIYVSGGVEAGHVINKMKCYIPDLDEWQPRSPMLAARAGHTMSTVGSQIIVCGGRPSLEGSRCLASVESYSVELDQWTYLTPMRNDCSHMTAVVLDGKLLLVGGENSVGDLEGNVKEYDPENDKWRVYCKLNFPMKNAGVCGLTINLDKSEVQSNLYSGASRPKFPGDSLPIDFWAAAAEYGGLHDDLYLEQEVYYGTDDDYEEYYFEGD